MHTGINVASLVGHNTVRRLVMAWMIALLRMMNNPEWRQWWKIKCRKGCRSIHRIDLFTGQGKQYQRSHRPCRRAAATENGVYVSYTQWRKSRHRCNKWSKSISASLLISPVEISHFKVSHKANWGRSIETIVLSKMPGGGDMISRSISILILPVVRTAALPDWAFIGWAGFVGPKDRRSCIA